MNEISQEKVYRVLHLVSESPQMSQRDVASSTGLSLGLVNITLKRLVQTGYIKVSNLDKRKVEYLLTTKGIMEKATRTYRYLADTIKTFKTYQSRLQQIITELMQEGHNQFAVVGEGEIVSLMETVMRSFGTQIQFRHLPSGQNPKEGEIVLDCRLNGRTVGDYGVAILSRLLNKPPLKPRVKQDESSRSVQKNALTPDSLKVG